MIVSVGLKHHQSRLVLEGITACESLDVIHVTVEWLRNFVLQFIAGCVRGVFSCGFCDFGEMFEVMDHTGEEPAEFFISGITKVHKCEGERGMKEREDQREKGKSNYCRDGGVRKGGKGGKIDLWKRNRNL